MTMVDKVIDAASSTSVLRVDLPKPKGDIPGGVRCSAKVEGMPANNAPRLAARSGL